MKKAYCILTSFFSLITVLSLCYYVSFQSAVKNEQKNQIHLQTLSADQSVYADTVDTVDTTSVDKTDEEASFLYYVTAKDGFVMVYKGDKSTIYENTGIVEAGLAKEQREQIMAGIYVYSEDELYGLLESLTS